MDFNKLILSWSWSTARKIDRAIRLYGSENFELAKRDLDKISIQVVENQGGWARVCELKLAEPKSLRQIWAEQARVFLDQQFPEVTPESMSEVREIYTG